MYLGFSIIAFPRPLNDLCFLPALIFGKYNVKDGKHGEIFTQ